MVILNLGEAQEWLEILHGDSQGLINICSTLDWRGRFFYPGTEIDVALEYIQKLDSQKAEGIYLRATTLKSRPESGRGGDDLSLMLPGLWADLDLAGPGHKTKGTLPPTTGTAMAIIAASGLPEPSHWIHSGGGLYPWWLLRNATEIDDPEAFRALSSGWQKIIEAASLKLGFSYGSGIGDLSRVLRIPGTVNRKEGLERPCTALEGHAWSGPVYELAQLQEALEAATPAPPAPSKLEVKQTTIDGLRPGDDFNQRMNWYDLLLPLGWTWVYKRGDKWHLRRPGKTSGTSATLSSTTGNLYIFSEECQPLESFRHYSKFHFYAQTEHGGNHAAAAKDLAQKGFGTPIERTGTPAGSNLLLDSAETVGMVPSKMAAPVTAISDTKAVDTASPVGWDEEFPAPKISPQDWLTEDFDLQGAGNLFAKAYEDAFRYCTDSKRWWFWAGKVWKADGERFEAASKALLTVGKQAARQAALNQEDHAKALGAHIRKLATASSPNIGRWARSDKRIRITCDRFDDEVSLLTTANGIYDLKSHTIMPFDPKALLTKQINVEYDKDALAPRWQKFLESALPDPAVREYIQKAAGYTMLGTSQERALFLLHGPSGTGKSVFIRVMEQMFGDFAETATPATFNESSKRATLTNDLNDLKGKRFVCVSETDEGERLNESLIKRLTGGDTAKSRALFNENTTWRVKFSLWLATNNLPQLTSDDNAIWRRVKPIHFTQVAGDNGGEVLGLAEDIFASEASGVLNWLLEGARMYQAEGLADTDQIRAGVEEYRKEVDVVEQFVSQMLEEGSLVAGEGREIAAGLLHNQYREWCHANGYKGILRVRRFGARVERMGFSRRRISAGIMWQGIGPGSHGLLGTMFPMRT